MLRILLSVAAPLAACTPSPHNVAMPSPSPVSAPPVQSSSTSRPPGDASGDASAAATPSAPGIAHPARPAAALTPGAASENAKPDPLADSPVAALGRRILSTAFVRVGPGGHLTVELHDGRVLVLRDVTMRPTDYCGVQVAGESANARYCGGYADVVAARPGGA